MQKRRQYFERTNLPSKVEKANTRSHLEFEEEKIVHLNGPFAKVELAGKIIIDNLKEMAVSNHSDMDPEDVKLLRNSVPFRLVVDLQMAPVTALNTCGVMVVDYYEFD